MNASTDLAVKKSLSLPIWMVTALKAATKQSKRTFSAEIQWRLENGERLARGPEKRRKS